MIVSGVSVAFVIGTVLTWRALALTGEILINKIIMNSVTTEPLHNGLVSYVFQD